MVFLPLLFFPAAEFLVGLGAEGGRREGGGGGGGSGGGREVGRREGGPCQGACVIAPCRNLHI